MKNIYLTLVTSLLIVPTYLNAQSPSLGPNGQPLLIPVPPVDPTASVPEPSIIALLGLGVAAIFLIKKFKK